MRSDFSLNSLLQRGYKVTYRQALVGVKAGLGKVRARRQPRSIFKCDASGTYIFATEFPVIQPLHFEGTLAAGLRDFSVLV